MALEGIQLGQYYLKSIIGSGGMGEVYLAEDARIGQQVAIKVSRTEVSPYPNATTVTESARLFQREARAIAQLDHPHILPLHSYGEEQIRGELLTYIVMPYRREGSLVAWLRQRTSSGFLGPSEVAAIVTQAAEALQYAHDHHVIHQDVKPANFLVRNRNDGITTVPDLLLTDFGIAKLRNATSHSSHAVRGTAAYMAPEQWSGQTVPATDQYALAIMAYELLTGRTPFQGAMEQLLFAHVSTPPQPPSAFNPRISSQIDRVLLHALAKRPEERFPSIAAFASAFQQAVQNSNSPYASQPAGSNSISGAIYPPPMAPVTPPNSQALSGYGNSMRVPPPPPPLPVTNYGDMPAPVKQQTRWNMKYLLIVGLVLLVILGGAGGYFLLQLLNPAPGSAIAIALNKNPYAPYTGTLALSDPLRDNSKGNNWDTSPTEFGTCNFTDKGYDVTSTRYFISTYHRCMAEKTDFSNFAYQVDMTFVSGSCGALLFRANTVSIQDYYFRICRDGTYALELYSGPGYTGKTLISGPNSAIHSDTNEFAVVANNTTINIYINHQSVATVQDSTYSHGQIGFAADSSTSSTEVIFSNAKVWTW